MHRRYNLTHFLLAIVIVLGLTLLMVCVDAQAQIAFVSDRDGNFNVEIYVMDADGSNQQNLTNNPRDDRDPSWSPDGKRIVFSARRDGHFENKFTITHEIYVMDADGGNQQRLTNNRHGDFSPAWLNSPFSVSPAGKKFTMWGWLKQVGR